MGIKRNIENPKEDLMIDLLECFCISEKYNVLPTQFVNQYTKNSSKLKEII
jgi:hypothetical protein